MDRWSRPTSPRWSTSAGPCAGTRRWWCPGCPGSPAARSGIWGYDVVRTIESLPDAPPDDRDLPDAIVMVADTLLVLDNLFNRATVIASVEVPAGTGADGAAPALRRAPRAGSSAGWSDSAHAGHDAAARHRDRPAPADAAAIGVPIPTTGSRTTCAGSRSTSPRATPSRRCLSRRLDLPAPDPVPHLPLSPGAQSRAVPLLTSTATTSTSSAARPRSWCGWRTAR